MWLDNTNIGGDVMNFLDIKGLKKSFGQGESHIDVLKGIDMTINKGEFCVTWSFWFW